MEVLWIALICMGLVTILGFELVLASLYGVLSKLWALSLSPQPEPTPTPTRTPTAAEGDDFALEVACRMGRHAGTSAHDVDPQGYWRVAIAKTWGERFRD